MKEKGKEMGEQEGRAKVKARGYQKEAGQIFGVVGSWDDITRIMRADSRRGRLNLECWLVGKGGRKMFLGGDVRGRERWEEE